MSKRYIIQTPETPFMDSQGRPLGLSQEEVGPVHESIPPTNDPAMKSVSLADAARELNWDYIDFMKEVGFGEIETINDIVNGEIEERVSRTYLDRLIAEREEERRVVEAALWPGGRRAWGQTGGSTS